MSYLAFFQSESNKQLWNNLLPVTESYLQDNVQASIPALHEQVPAYLSAISPLF